MFILMKGSRGIHGESNDALIRSEDIAELKIISEKETFYDLIIENVNSKFRETYYDEVSLRKRIENLLHVCGQCYNAESLSKSIKIFEIRVEVLNSESNSPLDNGIKH